MAEIVYGLCTITSLLSLVLLVRSYLRKRSRFLFWSTLCFLGLVANNFMLLLDFSIFPAVDLSFPRQLLAFGGMAAMVFGFIGEVG